MHLIAITFLILAAQQAFASEIMEADIAYEKLTSGEIIILDIRSEREWKESGIAEGAFPISMHEDGFGEKLGLIFSQFRPEQVALICATGGRTAHVTRILRRNGATGIIDISEGMFGNGTNKGWIERGLPVVNFEQAQLNFDKVKADWK